MDMRKGFQVRIIEIIFKIIFGDDINQQLTYLNFTQSQYSLLHNLNINQSSSKNSNSKDFNKDNKSDLSFGEQQKEMLQQFKDGDLVQYIDNIKNLFDKIMDFTLIKDSRLILSYFKDDENCKIKLVEKIEKSDNQKYMLEKKIKYYTKGEIIYLGIENVFKCNDDYYIILQFLNTLQIVENYEEFKKDKIKYKQQKAPIKMARAIMGVFVYLFEETNKQQLISYLNNHSFQLIYREEDENLYILSFIRARKNIHGQYIEKFSFNEDKAFQIIGNCILNFYTGQSSIIRHTGLKYIKYTLELMENSTYSQTHIYFQIIAALLIHGYRKLQPTIKEVDEILKLYEDYQTYFEDKPTFKIVVNNITYEIKNKRQSFDSLDTLQKWMDILGIQ